MRVSTREAIIGLVVYRLARYAFKRSIRKGVGMGTAKRVGILAAIGAALGALMFWRKKKKGGEAPV